MARIKKRFENPEPDPIAPIVQAQDEIDELISQAEEMELETDYPDMTYEHGLIAMYQWLIGEGPHPF